MKKAQSHFGGKDTARDVLQRVFVHDSCTITSGARVRCCDNFQNNGAWQDAVVLQTGDGDTMFARLLLIFTSEAKPGKLYAWVRWYEAHSEAVARKNSSKRPANGNRFEHKNAPDAACMKLQKGTAAIPLVTDIVRVSTIVRAVWVVLCPFSSKPGEANYFMHIDGAGIVAHHNALQCPALWQQQ